MPLFTYECTECGNIFENFNRKEDENTLDNTCPQCKSIKTIRYIGKSSFILKGFGWAKHGYCSKPTTPIESDDGRSKYLTRMAHYADRNTGKSLGFGPPQTIETKE